MSYGNHFVPGGYTTPARFGFPKVLFAPHKWFAPVHVVHHTHGKVSCPCINCANPNVIHYSNVAAKYPMVVDPVTINTKFAVCISNNTGRTPAYMLTPVATAPLISPR